MLCLRPSVLCLAILILVSLESSSAQPVVEIHGYAKNLAIRSSSPVTRERFFLNVSRFRVKGLLHTGTQLHAEAWLDTELLAGSFLDTELFAQARDVQRPLLNLDWTVASGKSFQAQQRLFRAFASFYTGNLELTVGRQRIAWGSGFAWNPTDIINPFDPGAIELGERSGVDAAYATFHMSPVSRIELVAATGDRWKKTSYGARFSTNYYAYDISVMSAIVDGDWVFGGDLAGYLGGAGLRGEAAYTLRAGNTGSLRAILNADYSFPIGIYGLVEVYYNSSGSRHKEEYDINALLEEETFSLATRYVATSLGTSFTPLLGGSLYGLANLDDQSALVGPAFTVSLAENLDMAASTYFFFGKHDTEYGAQRHVFFASIQWYY